MDQAVLEKKIKFGIDWAQDALILETIGGQTIFRHLNLDNCIFSNPISRKNTVSVDLRVSRIYRHLAASPLFGGQIAGAGGTPRLSYLPFQTMEMPLDGANTADS